jgi:signal transduction histidine kinase
MLQFCPWEAAKYFVYSSNIPTLFFYSHIPAILVAIFVGFLVFYKSGKSKVGISLLIVSILFSLWCVFDLILWATNRPDIVIFFWSLQILFEPLVYLMCFYLVYLFVKNKDLLFNGKIILFLLYFPIILLLSSKYNLQGVNLVDCTAIEGFIAQYYTYIIESIFILAIIFFVVSEFRKISNSARKKEIIIFGLGIILFLIAFSSGNIIGSFTDNWNLAQAGLIGMPIFIGFLAYLIVRFHEFNIKLFATQALVWGLVILIGSQFLFIKIPINFVLNGITFIATIISGSLLIRSVKKEIQQKEDLSKLNKDLENVIQQRESLMHLINHKVKGSFTHSKYIFAGLLDGMFGEITPAVKKIAQMGLDSDTMGIRTIDLILNATNLENGTIKYEMQPVDLKDVVQKIIEGKKTPIEQKGLALETELKDEKDMIEGDIFWLKEVVNNLIENALDYTEKGKISIGLEKKPARPEDHSGGENKILFTVKDTGVGITEEDKNNLFKEGGRGKESVKTNVNSTGYGLYSVKLIVEAHKGRVWAESEGKDKGSEFFVEFDAI